MYFLTVLESENLRSAKIDKASFLSCKYCLLTMCKSLHVRALILLDHGSALLASFNLNYFLRDQVILGLGSQHMNFDDVQKFSK